MADFTFTSTNEAVQSGPDELIRKITVTATSNSSSTTGNGNVAHGGPIRLSADGSEALNDVGPKRYWTVPITDSSTGGEVMSVFITNFDNINGEVDFTLNTAAAVTSSETVTFEIFCVFDARVTEQLDTDYDT